MFLVPLRSRVARVALPKAVQLWMVYALFFVAGVAQAAIVPLLPRLTGRFGLSASQAALLLALPGLATLAVSVPSGVAADRLGARRVTLTAGALLGLSCVAQAAPSLPGLLLGRIAFGVAFGVVWTTGMAWLAELSEDGGRSGMAPSVTCSSVGIMVGPAVGGILAQIAGLGAPFVAIAVTTAFIIVALAGGTAAGEATPSPPVAPSELPLEIAYSQPPIRDVPDLTPRALVAMARRPRVSAAAAALVVSGAVSSASQLLVSADLHQLGLSTGKIGLAFSAAAILYIVVSAAVVRLGHRAHTLRVNALAAAALAGALLPALAGGGLVFMMAALLLAAAPRAVISTIAYSLASEQGSQDGGGDGVVFGMLNGAWAAATVLMPLLAGAAEQQGGQRAGYLAVIIPAGLIAGWLVPRSRARTRRARSRYRSVILQRVLR
jgi:MFS family permease